MATHTGQAFIVYVEPNICQCDHPRAKLFTSTSKAKAEQLASAHWSIYVTFYGHLTHWLDIIVVDTRDGVMVWRNGRPLKEGKDGQL